MTPAEAAVLLSAISANDNREVTESGSRAWAAALPDVALADALEILPEYYRGATRDTRNWIYPGDVLEATRALCKRRRRDLLAPLIVAVHAARMSDDPEAHLAAMSELKRARDEYDQTHVEPGPSPRELLEAADARAQRQEFAS